MNLLVTQVWPEFGADPQFAAAFGSVLLEKVEQRRQSRRQTAVVSGRFDSDLDESGWKAER